MGSSKAHRKSQQTTIILLCQTTIICAISPQRDTMDYLEPARTTTEAACYDPKVQRSAPQCRHTPPVPTASTLN